MERARVSFLHLSTLPPCAPRLLTLPDLFGTVHAEWPRGAPALVTGGWQAWGNAATPLAARWRPLRALLLSAACRLPAWP